MIRKVPVTGWRSSAAILLCLLALAFSPASAQLKLPAPRPGESTKPKAPAKPAAAPEVDPQVMEAIFSCVAPGLPKDWARAWINVTSIGSYDAYLAEFHVATTPEDRKGKPLESPCGPVEMGTHLRVLNRALTPEQKKWPKARILFTRDGKYEVNFDKP